MKLNGRKLETPNEEVVVIPRGSNPDDAIIFKCRAVLSFEAFEKLYPQPKAPKMQRAGSGEWVEDLEDADYQKAVTDRNLAEFNWMILQSLKATEGLEFETVKDNDPDTWNLVETEFKDAGFSQVEVNRIVQGVLQANCLDESKLEQARQSFIRSQAAAPSA